MKPKVPGEFLRPDVDAIIDVNGDPGQIDGTDQAMIRSCSICGAMFVYIPWIAHRVFGCCSHECHLGMVAQQLGYRFEGPDWTCIARAVRRRRHFVKRCRRPRNEAT